jgi:hypothetical protein
MNNKQEIAGQLNSLIYSGDGNFTVDDIMEIVGDGDPFEYI